MFNLILFQQEIIGKYGLAYSPYLKLCNSGLVNHPMIFTDNITTQIDNNIPIFSTFYLRQHYINKKILLDYEDYKYLNQTLHKKCIILYSVLNEDLKNINDCLAKINITNDIESALREVMNVEL